LLACFKGTHYDTATLTVRKAGDKPLEYIVMEMKECLITAVSTGGSGGEDRLTENVTINFAEVSFKYQEQDPKGGKKGGTKDAVFNIAENSEA
jgi:type VI secretion system secreted protein Hcp